MTRSGSSASGIGSVSGFLREVISLKQRDVAEASAKVSPKEIRASAEALAAETVKRASSDPAFAAEVLRRSFLHAMESSTPGHAGIIAEIKKASPSKGDIRVDLNPATYAEAYTHAGASAISVLTESHYFKGSIEDLKAVRTVTHLPVLRKDFTLSSYQIYEARTAGADAVLLITIMLSREQLRDYTALTRELGMEPLVEIHSEWELENALFANAKVIGINNRNLQTLKTDTTVAKRVAPFFTEEQIPVEASGISSPEEICKGMESRIFNFLVGESIVRAENTKEFVNSLVTAGASHNDDNGEDEKEIDQSTSVNLPDQTVSGPDNSGGIGDEEETDQQLNRHPSTLSTQSILSNNRFFKPNRKKAAVKICGLTTPDEAKACVDAGADAIGFVFYPKSPRNLTMEQAAEISNALPMDVMTTGVFVDESYEFIMERVRGCGLKAAQLHGNESPELISTLKTQGVIVIKALFAARAPYLNQADTYKEAHAVLVEYGKGTLPGGNAESWNWKLARDAATGGEDRKIILAGGINPDNIASAVEQAQPWGIDLSSGVESSPGRKDIGKVKELLSKLS